jgi:hypothetical protein
MKALRIHVPMVFVFRHFAGLAAQRVSPVGTLTGSAALTSISLYLFCFSNDSTRAFLYATIHRVETFTSGIHS